MPDISIEKVHVSFNSKAVLNGADLQIGSGTSTVILGGSGSGKSVLLKTIIGLIKVQRGAIRIDNIPKNRGITHSCGMLFQNSALFDSLTTGQNIMFGAPGTSHMRRGAIRKKAIGSLRMVELEEDILDYYPESLSGGMRKRVSLARTIALNPKIILLDEPTTGLDPVTAEAINQLVVKLHRELALTVITVTHDIKSAIEIADNIAMIEEGIISWTGDKNDFMHTDHKLARSFLNASRF